MVAVILLAGDADVNIRDKARSPQEPPAGCWRANLIPRMRSGPLCRDEAAAACFPCCLPGSLPAQEGQSALYWAARSENRDILNLLLSSGATLGAATMRLPPPRRGASSTGNSVLGLTSGTTTTNSQKARGFLAARLARRSSRHQASPQASIGSGVLQPRSSESGSSQFPFLNLFKLARQREDARRRASQAGGGVGVPGAHASGSGNMPGAPHHGPTGSQRGGVSLGVVVGAGGSGRAPYLLQPRQAASGNLIELLLGEPGFNPGGGAAGRLGAESASGTWRAVLAAGRSGDRLERKSGAFRSSSKRISDTLSAALAGRVKRESESSALEEAHAGGERGKALARAPSFSPLCGRPFNRRRDSSFSVLPLFEPPAPRPPAAARAVGVDAARARRRGCRDPRRLGQVGPSWRRRGPVVPTGVAGPRQVGCGRSPCCCAAAGGCCGRGERLASTGTAQRRPRRRACAGGSGGTVCDDDTGGGGGLRGGWE